MDKNKPDFRDMRKPRRELRTVRRLLSGLLEQDVPDWLMREHYLLCGMCRSVIDALQTCPAIPYTVNTQKSRVPYAFAVSETIPPDANTEEMIASLAHFQPDEAFLRHFPVLRAASVLCRIAQYRTCTEPPKAIGAWLDQLRQTKEIDWTEVHDRLSAVEKLLMEDPDGAYPLCDDETKAAYHTAVYRRARKAGITEEEAAADVLVMAKNSDRGQLASILFAQNRAARGVLWHLILYGSAFLLSVSVAFLLHAWGSVVPWLVGCALFLPFCALVRECANRIAVRYGRAFAPPVLRYRIAPGTIPQNGRVLTVITSLLRGGAHDHALVRNLERFYLRNRDDNAFFGLLCDLPSADSQVQPTDEAVLSAVRDGIATLNRKYGDRFCVFVRARSYCEGERCYMGWERKRGAVLMLARLLRGIGTEDFLCIDAPGRCTEQIRYICTLDEDTVLPPDALCKLVGAMLHPYNTPQTDGGAVRRGCAILQPAMATTLEGAAATRFTLLCCGRGGMDPYSRFHIDGESILYGEGSFCGKGIFEIDAFLDVLDGAFPDHAVLSHDFLEGARLGCRNDSAVTFSDGVPKTPNSYFSRQNRWVRGDVQALRFAFSSHRNASGVSVKNPISVSARLRIIDHVLSALTPPAMLRAVLLFAFLPLPPGSTALLWLLLFSPFLLRPLEMLLRPWSWKTLFRQFFAVVLCDLRQSLYWLGYRVMFLGQEGWVNTKAVVTALYRMLISKRRMLEWVTAGEGDRRSGGSAAVMFGSMRASVLLGAVLLLFSPHMGAKLLGLLWICAPWMASYLSSPPKIRYAHRFSADFAKKKPDGTLTSEEYRALAAPIWQYFADHVNAATHHLPPDNVQWFPLTEKKIAMRTSPTNIGLYLCACISACAFGFIDAHELWERLENALAELSQLRRYKGHFFNWYDLHNGEVIGVPYISAVDSGNLACALICAAQGALEYAKDEIRLSRTAKKLQYLAEDMDFSFLYHRAAKQLHIGYDAQKQTLSSARYDLYASEVRSAVYFAVAMGQIPAEAWTHLGKPITEQNRHIGIRSWTGSAFEYFMPSLWLPTPMNSVSAEMLSFAFEAQAADPIVLLSDSGCLAVFGKSEGAYFGLDAARNFQYQPYGVQSLALCGDMARQTLCMPYALYLMLPFAPQTVKGALDAVGTLGMSGPYGLYEALDATDFRVGGGYAIVRSYMAHHMGMSLMALTNAAFVGLHQRYFLSDDRMEAYLYLLQERIAADAPSTPSLHRPIPPERHLPLHANTERMETATPHTAVLSNTASFLVGSSDGGMTLYHGKLALTPTAWDMRSLAPTFFCYDAVRNAVYTPCRRSAMESCDAAYSFRETADALCWEGLYADGTRCQLTARVSTEGIGFAFLLELERNGCAVPYVMTAYFRPVLYDPYAYAVHRTFADLFLGAAADMANSTVYLERRPRSAEERSWKLSVKLGGLDHFGASADASRLLGIAYTEEDCLALGRKTELPARLTPRMTYAAVPLLCMRGRAAHGRATMVLSLGEVPPVFDAGLLARIRGEMRMLCANADLFEYVDAMLSAIAQRRGVHLIQSTGRLRPIRAPHGKARFWKYGISGDLPCICLTVGEEQADLARASAVLAAWKYLLLCGIPADLVLCTDETDAYGNPADRSLHETIEALGLQFFLGGGGDRGGIHICRRQEIADDGIFLSAVLVIGEDDIRDTMAEAEPVILMSETGDTATQYTLDDRCAIVNKGKQPMPWTFLLSNGVFSTLLTTNTLGFTFFENARECRVTPWYGDAVSERCGELLLLSVFGTAGYHDLCRASSSVVITTKAVHYLGLLPQLSYRVNVSVPDRTRHKRMEIRLKNESAEPLTLSLRYQLQPLLGVIAEDCDAVSWNEENRTLLFRTETNESCAPYTAAVSLVGCEEFSCGAVGADQLYVGGTVCIPACEEVCLTAHLRILRDGERSVAADALVPIKAWRTPRIRSGNAGLDALVSTWLPWQIVGVRMYGRCGYYQPGGAYGFRDQLQDAMAAAEFAPELLYAQLFRAASHQYLEGDVQHWWHPGPISDRAKYHRGIRSRCSDDRLWLPLAAARYASLTEDVTFLQKTVRYLESPVLSEGEGERYETPLRSEVRESLYMHCVRAIERSLDDGFGVHGMPYIGIGDWNDGMNRVGVRGQGETVWGGMFLMLVLAEFLPLCETMGDEHGLKTYTAVIRHLACAIEAEAWNGKWYRRAWYDDGTPMGDPGDAEAEIDLLPQAFAAIVNSRVRLPGGGKPLDEERVHAAMLAAYERLFDEKHGVFALLAPAFGTADGDVPNPGYIAGYPPGARENGGQYTHAAVWGAMGLFAVGEEERAMRVVHALSPLSHTDTEEGIRRYQKEPWALCGDVLMTPGRVGEGGWSLYTGSAGWYYRLLTALFGKEAGESDA